MNQNTVAAASKFNFDSQQIRNDFITEKKS